MTTADEKILNLRIDLGKAHDELEALKELCAERDELEIERDALQARVDKFEADEKFKAAWAITTRS